MGRVLGGAPGHLDITSPRAVMDAPPPLLTSSNSWLKTHNGRPPLAPEAGGPLRVPPLPPSGTAVWEVVQLDNGFYLRPHSGLGRGELRGAVNRGGGVAAGHAECRAPLTDGRWLKLDRRSRLMPLAASCRCGDRCEGGGGCGAGVCVGFCVWPRLPLGSLHDFFFLKKKKKKEP